MRIALDPLRGDADEAQELICAFSALTSAHSRPECQEDIVNLRAERHDGVKRIHGALKDDGQIAPAIPAQFLRREVQQIDRSARSTALALLRAWRKEDLARADHSRFGQ